MLITANQPFGEWDKVFPDHAMTLAAIDRLVHHATIFEMNVESYRRRAALERKQTGRPDTGVQGQGAHAMLIVAPSDNQTTQNSCQRQSAATICPPSVVADFILIDAHSHPDRRATAALAVRRAQSGGDHRARLSRRTADCLPQSRAREERARKRDDLLAATERDLSRIVAHVRRRYAPLRGKAEIGLAIGAVIDRHKMGNTTS